MNTLSHDRDSSEQQPSKPEEAAPAAPAQPNPLPGLPFGIDQLLPALLEINIRQAWAGGETDLAQALQSLQRQLQAREIK